MNFMKRFIGFTLSLFCSLLISCAGVGSSNKSALLDTSQTKCYDNSTTIRCPSPGDPFYGQDAQYSINTPSYTDNRDGTVADNVTGLMWQQKADKGKYNWESATDFCSSLSLAGDSDWRLPTSMELMSIVHYGKSTPAIDTKYFHNVKGSWWWTSSTLASNSNKAYDVIFYRHGYIDLWDKSDESYFRCVRGGNDSALDTMAERYTDNGDTTITDNYVGLMWQQGETSSMTWEPALMYCNNLNLAGHNDWRLPNVKTLQSLVDSSKYGPVIDTTYFPETYSSLSYWTSTSDQERPKRGWTVNFDKGKVQYKEKSRAYYVRCTRGGK